MSITCTITAGLPADYTDALDEWQRDALHWTVTLHNSGRYMTVPFFTGSAITDPTCADVLESLLSDAASVYYGPSFEDWADELGWDTDSRRVERTYRQIIANTDRLRVLLGDAFPSEWDDTEVIARNLCA